MLENPLDVPLRPTKLLDGRKNGRLQPLPSTLLPCRHTRNTRPKRVRGGVAVAASSEAAFVAAFGRRLFAVVLSFACPAIIVVCTPFHSLSALFHAPHGRTVGCPSSLGRSRSSNNGIHVRIYPILYCPPLWLPEASCLLNPATFHGQRRLISRRTVLMLFSHLTCFRAVLWAIAWVVPSGGERRACSARADL